MTDGPPAGSAARGTARIRQKHLGEAAGHSSDLDGRCALSAFGRRREPDHPRPGVCHRSYLLRKRLALRRPVTYVDATNMTRQDRRGYISSRDCSMRGTEAMIRCTPVEVCKERNRGRDRVVPEWAIDAMAARLQPPSVEEGFDAVETARYSGGQSLGTAGC